MESGARVLIVADDAPVGRWLQHRIDALGLARSIEVEDGAAFDSRPRGSLSTSFDVLVAALDFAAPVTAAAHDWISRAACAGAPPVLVVADNGDELAAVGALRHGAADYLPRHLLTPPMMAASLRAATHARRDSATGSDGGSAAAPVLPGRLPRDLVPRYLLLDTLGESARATVYLAHSDALERHVALKVSRGGDEEPAFAREFAAAGTFRHPAVVDIYDYGVHDGREFIAMEYFPCGDLKARLQNPLSELECLEYLERIALGLSVVHTQGLVHRDLKPPNIMLREGGEIVLIDFGIAKSLGAAGDSTRTGVLRGSPYYMSPEQAQGELLDARSDLYSLGVIFYEMLVGTKPYVAGTAMGVLQKHVDQAVPTLPPAFTQHQSLLEGLMAKDRSDRFASADALLESLHRVAA
jgi:DNA-binding response OmpR family regulator